MSTALPIPDRPCVLSIAGFDPSGGAGLLADVKTFEGLRCYGLAVNTANTVQNDVKFETCHWTSEPKILEQLESLQERFPVEVVKIGITKSLQVLNKIVDKLLVRNKNVKIVWDPVLRSSSGFSLMDLGEFQENLEPILEKIFVVTPNFEELQLFYPAMNLEETIQELSSKTNLFVTGGHRTEKVGMDELFTTGGDILNVNPGRRDCSEKHGSGCVLSSALAAHLALGSSMSVAVKRAKDYVEKVLASNQTLLGYHNI